MQPAPYYQSPLIRRLTIIRICQPHSHRDSRPFSCPVLSAPKGPSKGFFSQGFAVADQPCPDKKLVYLHCSPIFSGANAKVRRPKKIYQLLEQHKVSITIPPKYFTLPAIATVVKELLDEEIFESPPRAKLIYPELFQPSEAQEAERAASEAEVVRIEAHAVHDIVVRSDVNGGEECPENELLQRQVVPEMVSKAKAEAPDNVRISAAEGWQVSA